MHRVRIALLVTVLAATVASCDGSGSKPSTRAVGSTTTTADETSSTAAATDVTASTAPTEATPSSGNAPSIAGCELFPADNAWRRDVSGDPVDPHSGAWVASVGADTHLHPDFGSDQTYGIPYVTVPATQAKVPVSFEIGDESDPGPYPVPSDAPVEAGGDHHVLVASADCHLYELYDASRDANGAWKASSGAVFDLRSNGLRTDGWTSADAAGLPIIPGLVRREEVEAGHIDHALRFTVSRSQRGFIHPATHQAGSSADANLPPMGARFRLKASYDLSTFKGAARVVLECLRRYGMFVADNGSDWYLSGARDTNWNDADLEPLKTVPGSAFEVVASGPVLH